MEALANKYRPRRFDDILGQKAVSQLLKQMVIKGTAPTAMLLTGPRGSGKAQPLDSLVLTPFGFRPMSSLKIGDSVADPEGGYSEVVGIFPQGSQRVYRLTFSDGSSCESTLDHLWELEIWKGKKCKGKRHAKLEREVKTTAQWADFIKKPSYRAHRARLVSTASLDEFDMTEENLPLDPYLLGALLGDGSISSGSPRLETADIEILEAVSRVLPSGIKAKFVTTASKSSTFNLTAGQMGGAANPITTALRDLQVWGTKSDTKFVPNVYKEASAKTRLAVLQGLMDTDGNWASSGAQFSSASKKLRDDVVWLARSLGLRVTSHSKNTSYRYKGESLQGKIAYTASIRDTKNLRVFRLSRKLKEVSSSTYYRYLVSVEYSRDIDCQCIKVSAPSQLYITNDFIPTHNTTTARVVAAAVNCEISSDPPCGSCSSCESIFSDSSLDYREIDASTNGLVDNIRKLQEDILYQTPGKMHIITLDEVQGLSSAASNALLKTLENAPEGVMFILVSTESDKILSTIKSRCMSFQFRKVSPDVVAKRLYEINKLEHLGVDSEALVAIADRSDGALRDALVTLDQISRAGVTTFEEFKDLFGNPDFAPSLMLTMFHGDYAKAYELLDSHLKYTGDSSSVVAGLVNTLRDILVLQGGGSLDVRASALKLRTELAQKVATERVLAAMKALWDLKVKLRIGEDSQSSLNLVVSVITQTLSERPKVEYVPSTVGLEMAEK
jgi:DNA polymerase III subunit gamma/tau